MPINSGGSLRDCYCSKKFEERLKLKSVKEDLVNPVYLDVLMKSFTKLTSVDVDLVTPEYF